MESQILDADLKPIEVTKVKEKAIVRDGKVKTTAMGRSFEREISSGFTSNWSLFDAVQRLPGEETSTLDFTLLEDLDLIKDRQQLSYWQSAEFGFGESICPLVGYQHTGQGILPYQYWVDEHNRLLFVISGIRAYIFDPNAQKDMEQQS